MVNAYKLKMWLCRPSYLIGIHTRRKRSTAIAARHRTETRVSRMTTQLMKRQVLNEVFTGPSTTTANGIATQPTRKSATASETIRQKVVC